MSDRVDEWMMGYLTEFDGKSFQDVCQRRTRLEQYHRADIGFRFKR